MLQLHLREQQFYCLLRCDLYQRFEDTSYLSRRVGWVRLSVSDRPLPLSVFDQTLTCWPNKERSFLLKKWLIFEDTVCNRYLYLLTMFMQLCASIFLEQAEWRQGGENMQWLNELKYLVSLVLMDCYLQWKKPCNTNIFLQRHLSSKKYRQIKHLL